ncbi:MAG: hypothetical protein AAGJ46_15785 [Planctomycetota bacterium]
MKRFIAISILLAVAPGARGQEEDTLVLASPWDLEADETLLSDEPQTRGWRDSLVSLFKGPRHAPAAGPGFRRGFRLWGAAADVSDGLEDSGAFDGVDNTSAGVPLASEGYRPGGVLFIDYGDLHTFDIRFTTLTQEQRQGLRSLELVGQHVWSRKSGLLTPAPALRLNAHGLGLAAEIGQIPSAETAGPADPPRAGGWFAGAKSVNYVAYGLRMNQGIDAYLLEGESNVLGYMGSNTRVDHWSIGPQASVGRVTAIDHWTFDLSGHLMLAYSRVEIEQTNRLGSDLAPGALNRPLLLQPTMSRHERSHDHFSPHAEVRLTSSYAIQRDWTVDAMARGYITGPWYESSEHVRYQLPDMGTSNTDPDERAGWDLYLGVTYFR